MGRCKVYTLMTILKMNCVTLQNVSENSQKFLKVTEDKLRVSLSECER